MGITVRMFAVFLAAAVLAEAGSISNPAYAKSWHHNRGGHHNRTTCTTEYAPCYQDGVCLRDGSCDVDGICQNGGNCICQMECAQTCDENSRNHHHGRSRGSGHCH